MAKQRFRMMDRWPTVRVVGLVGITFLLVNCRSDTLVMPSEDTRPGGPAMQTSATAGEVIVAAGNISKCSNDRDEATAKLIDNIPGTVVTLGDNAFPNGTAADYANCYHPTWGRHKARTYATLGNHEYDSGNANAAFDYFGERAGPRGKGYYSFDLGDWHIIVLNDNGSFVPSGAGSEQEQWLRADLAASTKRCTLAMWHVPRFFSSTTAGYTSSSARRILWDDLYAAKADIVLNGHQHHYERFVPQTSGGVRDDANGIRQFNVGTGGESIGMPTVIAANSEVISTAYGVLKLTLALESYAWEFIPIPGATFTDSGSGTCHKARRAASVEVTPASAIVQVGQTVQLAATPRDEQGIPTNGVVSWTSSDPAVATASNTGLVTGEREGSAAVTATSDGQSGTSAIRVTVEAPPPSENQPPVAAPGGPYPGTEGAAVSFNGSGSTDPDNNIPLSYAWNFGDGSTGTGTTPTHVYPQDGTYTVTLTVTDAKGLAGVPATTGAAIANAAPAVNAGPDASLGLGATLGLSATFSDPGSADAPWAYTIDWGDGATQTGSAGTQGAPITGTHSYGAVGQYTVRVTVTDKDGGAGSDDLVAMVNASSPGPVIVGAGNIAKCNNDRDEATAKLIDNIPGTVVALGSNAFPNGTAADYANCYHPTWGRHKARTYATLGNHEYDTGNADAAFDYFGERAGPRGKGYYSFDLGDWHVIVLNDNGSFVPFGAGSVQEQWLRADLAANTRRCTLAMWHTPRFFSSTTPGYTSSSARKILWDDLYAANADVVLNGSAHHYERFAPQTSGGVRDDANGIREFNVGTGGESVGMPTVIAANSEVISTAYGVLKLTLAPESYAWEFIPIPGHTFTDSGSGTCH